MDRLRGFGSRLLASDRVPLRELLRQSDIVTLHTPLTADTRHLLNRHRMEQMKQDMSEGDAPEGFPPSELIVMHDPETESSVVVVIFDNEDDYRKGDEILSAMPADNTPGQRTSVKKHDVAMRMSNA